MHVDDTARIPLRARDGSVRAYATVDATDVAWVAAVQVGGRKVYSKRFESEEDAAKAASEARRNLLPYAIESGVI